MLLDWYAFFFLTQGRIILGCNILEINMQISKMQEFTASLLHKVEASLRIERRV